MVKTVVLSITPHGPPLTADERRAAMSGQGEIGQAADVYNALSESLKALPAQFDGLTEVELMEAIDSDFDRVPCVEPPVARQLRRILSLRVRGAEKWLPKPTPGVVRYALAMVTRSLGGTSSPPMTTGPDKVPISASEYVTAWALREWHAGNPGMDLVLLCH